MIKSLQPIPVKGDHVSWAGMIKRGHPHEGESYTGYGIITKIYFSSVGGKRKRIACARVKIASDCGYPYIDQRKTTTISLFNLQKVTP